MIHSVEHLKFALQVRRAHELADEVLASGVDPERFKRRVVGHLARLSLSSTVDGPLPTLDVYGLVMCDPATLFDAVRCARDDVLNKPQTAGAKQEIALDELPDVLRNEEGICAVYIYPDYVDPEVARTVLESTMLRAGVGGLTWDSRSVLCAAGNRVIVVNESNDDSVRYGPNIRYVVQHPILIGRPR